LTNILYLRLASAVALSLLVLVDVLLGFSSDFSDAAMILLISGSSVYAISFILKSDSLNLVAWISIVLYTVLALSLAAGGTLAVPFLAVIVCFSMLDFVLYQRTLFGLTSIRGTESEDMESRWFLLARHLQSLLPVAVVSYVLSIAAVSVSVPVLVFGDTSLGVTLFALLALFIIFALGILEPKRQAHNR
jgi:hypothetical protein